MKVLMCFCVTFPQPEPTLLVCRSQHTTVIRHACTIEKTIHFFDNFLRGVVIRLQTLR